MLMPQSNTLNENIAALALKPSVPAATTKEKNIEAEEATQKLQPITTPPESKEDTMVVKDEFVSAKYNLPRLLVIE